MKSTTCKNCDNLFRGAFCNHCGQSAKVELINFKYFIKDIPHSVFHIDKGFFYSLFQLIKRPGFALNEYLIGKRVKHFKPFGFVIIMSTIATFLIKAINYFVNDFLIKSNAGFVLKNDNNFFQQYPSVLIFCLIPILSLVSWICFMRKKFNYWEHFLVNTYLAAYLNVFLLIIKIAGLIKLYFTNDPEINFTFFMFFFMAYYGLAFGQLMRGKDDRIKNIFIILLMNFFMATIYITAFSLVGIMSSWWGE